MCMSVCLHIHSTYICIPQTCLVSREVEDLLEVLGVGCQEQNLGSLKRVTCDLKLSHRPSPYIVLFFFSSLASLQIKHLCQLNKHSIPESHLTPVGGGYFCLLLLFLRKSSPGWLVLSFTSVCDSGARPEPPHPPSSMVFALSLFNVLLDHKCLSNHLKETLQDWDQTSVLFVQNA